jgi:ADP-ribose pyrophosphatase YjhB (NUDIX family)
MPAHNRLVSSGLGYDMSAGWCMCLSTLGPELTTTAEAIIASRVVGGGGSGMVEHGGFRVPGSEPHAVTDDADASPDRWQVLGTRPIYDSRWVHLAIADVVLPSGERIDHHVVTMPPAAMTVVINDARDSVLVSWRHRFIPDVWNYEIPGGLVEPGEDPQAAAVREVLEETGYRPRTMRHLLSFEPMIGTTSSPHHLYLAGVPRKSASRPNTTRACLSGSRLTHCRP